LWNVRSADIFSTSHSEPSLSRTPMTLDRVHPGMNPPFLAHRSYFGSLFPFPSLSLTFFHACLHCVLGFFRRKRKGRTARKCRIQGLKLGRHEPESPVWGAPSFSLRTQTTKPQGVSSEGPKLPRLLGRELILFSGPDSGCRRLVGTSDLLSPTSQSSFGVGYHFT
jgi:hypothetical protein